VSESAAATEKTKSEKVQAIQRSAQSIEQTVRECGVEAVRNQPPFMQAVRMAYGIKTIREALPDNFVRENFMPLQNSPLGFLTDAKEGYDIATVRDVICEALLRGVMPVNNEFNIISGRLYIAKNGFERLVREFRGLRDLTYELGVPQLAGDKGALVTCVATWYLEGVKDDLVCADRTKEGGIDSRIPVKVNGGMGADGILGKATRKMFARIYAKLIGSSADLAEENEEAVLANALPAPTEAKNDGRRIRLTGEKKSDEVAPAEAPAAAAPPPAPTEAEKLAAEAAEDEKRHAGK
jgi:hypothetical protein